MDILYKAQVFALFAIPAIFSIGVAEIGKPDSAIIKWGLYIFGAVTGILSLVLPFAH
jgi:hypothetical protein